MCVHMCTYTERERETETEAETETERKEEKKLIIPVLVCQRQDRTMAAIHGLAQPILVSRPQANGNLSQKTR